jgi:hypothetical protein
MARTPAMAAAHSALRNSTRRSRVVPNGATHPHSPPQNPQKVISLIGVNQCGPRTRGTRCSAAARQ